MFPEGDVVFDLLELGFALSLWEDDQIWGVPQMRRFHFLRPVFYLLR